MFGICVSPRMPISRSDLAALKPPFIRSILYSVVDDLDWLISLETPIWLVINNETDIVGHAWSGWENALTYIAQRGKAHVFGLSAGNELDLFNSRNPADVPPVFAAGLLQAARPILKSSGIALATTSLAGPKWPEYLEQMVDVGADFDLVDLHPYGRRPSGWGQDGWGFGTIEDAVLEARRITKRRVICTEVGVKVSDAGGEDGQAAYLAAAASSLATLVNTDAAWWAYHEDMSAPHERGEHGFGLLRSDGSRRPAFDAYAALHARQEAPVPTVADYQRMTREAARKHGLHEETFYKQIGQECGWSLDVIECRRDSGAGARGIGQIVPRFHPDVDPCNPPAALDYAARWMRALIGQYGNWRLALAAYNAGPGAVQQAGGVPPFAETQRYLDVILGPGWPEPGAAPVQPQKVVYNPGEPARPQEEDFDCSQESLEWALHAVGREQLDDEGWLEPTMIAEGVMSRARGLLDASGAGLAAFVRRHYAEHGYDANHEPLVTFQALAEEIGPYPMLIGGRGWNHWSGLRGYDRDRDLLLLANPANGHKGVGQTMSRAQFAALGPFSAVRILHPDLLAAAPPAPPQPPAPSRQRVLIAEIEARLAELKALTPA